MIEQGTPEWFEERLGKVTASRMSDVMSKGRGNTPSVTRTNYMMQLLCERLTGCREDTYASAAMLRGTELEPVARAAYEVHTNQEVTECGFIEHSYLALGASPDGLVNSDGEGILEIKCPNTAKHIACLQSGAPDSKYIKQMNCQMLCADAAWCDFVSFDDRLPEALQLFVTRVERDDVLIAEMIKTATEFLKELDELEANMRARMAETPPADHNILHLAGNQ